MHSLPEEPSFADVLTRARTEARLTQEALAARSGISVRAISDLECGHAGRPRRRSAQLLGTALGMSGEPLAAFLRAAGAVDALENAEPWARGPLCTLPPPPPVLAGRDAEMATLRSIATGNPTGLASGPTLVTLTGQPGVGKTALAVASGYDLAEHLPDGQLFITLQDADTTPVAPAAALSRLLAALGVAAATNPTHLDERVALYHSLLRDRRLLVILDNAVDEPQVRPLLPTGDNLALVTSRRRLSGLPATRRLFLDVLTDDDAAEMVALIVGLDRCAAEPRAVRGLVVGCGRLPLALRIAANRLTSRPDWSVQQLVDRLGDEHRRLDRLRAGDLTVRGPFEVSYAELDEPSAALFRRLALVDGPDFDPALAAALSDLDATTAEDVLDELVEASLVEPAGSGRYRLHDLLKLFAASTLARVDPADVRVAAEERMVDFLLDTAIYAGSYFELDDRITARLRQGRAGRSLPSRSEANTWLVVESVNWLGALRRGAAMGRHQQVVDLGEAVHWYVNLNGGADIWLQVYQLTTDSARAAGLRGEEAVHRNYLGWALDRVSGRSADAVREHQRALALAEEVGDRRQQAWSLMYLGRLRAFYGTGLDQAVTDCRTAVKLIDTVDDPAGAMMARQYLGCALERHGAYAEAETLLRQAEQQLLPWERRDGPGGAATTCLAHVQVTRARILLRLGPLTEVIAVADEAVDRFSALGNATGQGRAHRFAATAMAELGDLQGALRRIELAVALYADCAHPWAVDGLLTAADLYDRAGQTDRARAQRVRALNLAEQVRGDQGKQLLDRVRTALS